MKNKYICSGIRGVLKHEGLKSLSSRVYTYLLHRFFIFEHYYVVVVKFKDIEKEVESDYLPKLDEHCWRIISTNHEIDELVTDGFSLGAYELNLRMSMDRDAVAFCHFASNELAHYTFYADNPRGKNIIDLLPYNVDFENGYVISGMSLTVPKYRNLHLRVYNGYIMRKYFWSRGIVGSTYSVSVNNYPALLSHAKPPDKLIVSEYRFIKILCFKYLKKIEIEPTPLKQIVARMSEDKQTKTQEVKTKNLLR